MGKKIIYDLPPGLIITRRYKGKDYVLIVKESDGIIRFEVQGQTFETLTAAARFVTRIQSPINGPRFWNAQKKQN